MPVDYAQVDAIAAAVADVYGEAENALLALLTRHLQAGGFEDDTSRWAARKLGEVRALKRTAGLLVDELQRDGNMTVRQAVADGFRAGNASALTDLAQAQIGDIGPAARTADQTAGTAIQALADAVVEELRPVHSAVLRATDDAYRRAVAGATARRLAGARDTRRAIQDAWTALARQGITGFVDKAGRRWTLTAYVEMATRTAVARAAVLGEVDTWLAAGQRHAYVVDNPRECPMCAPWESKILDITDGPAQAPAVATLAQAQADGLHHPNCRHLLALWRPGMRITGARRPEGPAGYVAEQEQRRLERTLRGWRARYAAAFDDLGRQAAAAKIAQWSQALSEHLDDHPRLPRKSYREFPGAGFTAPKPARSRRDAARLARR